MIPTYDPHYLFKSLPTADLISATRDSAQSPGVNERYRDVSTVTIVRCPVALWASSLSLPSTFSASPHRIWRGIPLALIRPAISGFKEFSRETSPDGVLDAVVIQDSCPPRKLPVLRGYFHLFTLFDEKGNTDFYACLQLCCLGSAARRVAPNRWFRVGNLQLNEYWQL